MLQEKLQISHNFGETGQLTHTVLLSSESGSSEASLENENEAVRRSTLIRGLDSHIVAKPLNIPKRLNVSRKNYLELKT